MELGLIRVYSTTSDQITTRYPIRFLVVPSVFLSQLSIIRQRRSPCYWRAKASVSAQCSVTESHNCKQFFKRSSVHFLSLKFITMLLCDINEFGVKITFGVCSL